MSRDKGLNIAHLHWGFPPVIGGVETHLVIVLPEMVKLGHKVSILTGSVEAMPAYYNYNGVDVYRTPLMDLNWLYKRSLKGLDEELHSVFFSFIDKVKPDILHVHNMHYFSELHISIMEEIVKERSIPLFLTAHNMWDDLLCLEISHRIRWDHIIAVSHFIKKELTGIGVNETKISVIHHGIDQERFTPEIETTDILSKYPQLRDRPVVFHPARIGLAKGCDVSIKALNLVRERYPDVLLVLAGSKNIVDWGQTQQKDIAYLVSLLRYLKLENNTLIDVYTIDQMRQLYAVSDVCIYPSTMSEPFGLVMLEAMAVAKPMIVTSSGGMPEIIKDGINGFVIPVKGFKTLSAKIIQLLEDKELRGHLGTTGRQMVERYYTRQRVTQDILAIYSRFIP